MDAELETAYHEGISGQTVTDQFKFVLSLLRSLGPATSNQIMAYAKTYYPFLTYAQVSNVHKRLPELADAGAVRKQTTSYDKTKIIRCPVTNKMCCVWEVTGSALVTLTQRERLQMAVSKTKARLAVLEAKLAKA